MENEFAHKETSKSTFKEKSTGIREKKNNVLWNTKERAETLSAFQQC